MPLGLGPTEIAIILILVVLLVLMPSKLPQLARSVGESIREFRKASRELSESELSVIKEYEKRPEEKRAIDPKVLEKLADKLGIQKEGKSEDELLKEIVEKAREKGLI